MVRHTAIQVLNFLFHCTLIYVLIVGLKSVKKLKLFNLLIIFYQSFLLTYLVVTLVRLVYVTRNYCRSAYQENKGKFFSNFLTLSLSISVNLVSNIFALDSNLDYF